MASTQGSSDSFLMQAANPSLVDNPPPDPFVLLGKHETLQNHDIMRVLQPRCEWRFVPHDDIGSSTDIGFDSTRKMTIAYARVAAPGLYRIVADLDEKTIEVDWQYWHQGAWIAVSPDMVGKSAIATAQLLDQDAQEVGEYCVFAEPVDRLNPRLIPVPVHHRTLFPGESLRRGDKYVDLNSNGWQDVSDRVNGVVVAAPAHQNDYVRYCRPVALNAQSWYFSPTRGADGNLGGQQDPFLSQEAAIAAIEAAAEKTGAPICGMLWLLEPDPDNPGQERAVPRRAFDMPEPPPQETLQTAWMDSPMVDDATVDPILPAIGSCGDIARETSQAWETVWELAQTTIPEGFRSMQPGEEVRQGDRWFGPVGDDYDDLCWRRPTTAISAA